MNLPIRLAHTKTIAAKKGKLPELSLGLIVAATVLSGCATKYKLRMGSTFLAVVTRIAWLRLKCGTVSVTVKGPTVGANT